jgi:hypothetical protein
VTPVSGSWRRFDLIATRGLEERDIYHSPLEPSFVCWSILWRGRDGVLKLSFTEVEGDPAAWPPEYCAQGRGLAYYLKTLESRDGGASWRDTGWREDLDPRWELNFDHHIRRVFAAADGSLLRNYCHTLEGTTQPMEWLAWDEGKALSDPFPFTAKKQIDVHPKFASIWRSVDGGRAWKELHRFSKESCYFVTAIRQLRDGRIMSAGAVLENWGKWSTAKLAVSQSSDGGRTWTAPQVIAENDDQLVHQGIGEECDFVELDDGRLLLVERTDAPGVSMNMLQLYLSPDGPARWKATPPLPMPESAHSGYPWLHRASDGTIFYHTLTGILYSCDDGATWHQLPFGTSYYGQLVEASPGEILAVTHTNVGDGPFPYWHDTSLRQSRFRYARIPVAEQTDAGQLLALARLDAEDLEDFHLHAEIRADGETGIAFAMRDGAYRFAAVVVPCNPFRTPGRDPGREQDAVLMVGSCAAGVVKVERRQYLGKIVPRRWVQLQVVRRGDLVRVAVKPPDTPAVYAVVRGDFGGPGGFGLLTNRSTGAFRTVTIDRTPGEIRSNW